MLFINEAKTVSEQRKTYVYRSSWLQLARPMTLTGTISTILVGTGFAASVGEVKINIFLTLLLAAVLVQIAVNFFNDYYDFLKGQDQEKWMEFGHNNSHGKPCLDQIPIVAVTLLACASFLGMWLAYVSNYWIIVVGIFGILFGIGYSAGKTSLSARGLGEVVALIFLGFVPTTLAYVVQDHAIDLQILALSIPFALLISTMILTNNIRDLQKDKGFRNTLAMRIGRINATRLLWAILIVIYISVPALIFLGITTWHTILAYLAMPLAIRLVISFLPHTSRENEIKSMKWAALHHWAFGLLFAIGIWIATS